LVACKQGKRKKAGENDKKRRARAEGEEWFEPQKCCDSGTSYKNRKGDKGGPEEWKKMPVVVNKTRVAIESLKSNKKERKKKRGRK